MSRLLDWRPTNELRSWQYATKGRSLSCPCRVVSLLILALPFAFEDLKWYVIITRERGLAEECRRAGNLAWRDVLPLCHQSASEHRPTST